MRNDAKSNSMGRRCLDCGRQMSGTMQAYHYTECGLSSVKLQSVVVFECQCGSRVPVIKAIERLHFNLAVMLLRKQTRLVGEEIRFLRKMGGMRQAELARIMGIDETRPSKWESGDKPMGNESDRLFRSICFFKMLKHVMGLKAEQVDGFAESDEIKAIDLEAILKAIDGGTAAPEEINMPWPPPLAAGARIPLQ